MSKQRLTDWFPPSVNPVRAGLYEMKSCYGDIYFNKWDGKSWHWGSRYKQIASKSQAVKAREDCRAWRGLAADPSTSADTASGRAQRTNNDGEKA